MRAREGPFCEMPQINTVEVKREEEPPPSPFGGMSSLSVAASSTGSTMTTPMTHASRTPPHLMSPHPAGAGGIPFEDTKGQKEGAEEGATTGARAAVGAAGLPPPQRPPLAARRSAATHLSLNLSAMRTPTTTHTTSHTAHPLMVHSALGNTTPMTFASGSGLGATEIGMMSAPLPMTSGSMSVNGADTAGMTLGIEESYFPIRSPSGQELPQQGMGWVPMDMDMEGVRRASWAAAQRMDEDHHQQQQQQLVNRAHLQGRTTLPFHSTLQGLGHPPQHTHTPPASYSPGLASQAQGVANAPRRTPISMRTGGRGQGGQAQGTLHGHSLGGSPSWNSAMMMPATSSAPASPAPSGFFPYRDLGQVAAGSSSSSSVSSGGLTREGSAAAGTGRMRQDTAVGQGVGMAAAPLRSPTREMYEYLQLMHQPQHAVYSPPHLPRHHPPQGPPAARPAHHAPNLPIPLRVQAQEYFQRQPDAQAPFHPPFPPFQVEQVQAVPYRLEQRALSASPRGQGALVSEYNGALGMVDAELG